MSMLQQAQILGHEPTITQEIAALNDLKSIEASLDLIAALNVNDLLKEYSSQIALQAVKIAIKAAF